MAHHRVGYTRSRVLRKQSKRGRPARRPGAAAFESLPNLFAMGVCVFDPAWSQRWHKDPHAELLYGIHGRATITFAGQRFPLEAGGLAFVPPDTLHRDEFDAREEPEIFMAQFRWRAASAFFQLVTNDRLAALPTHRCDEARRLVLRLREHAANDTDLDRALGRALLHVLLLQLWTDVRGAPPPERIDRRRDLVERARRYLDTHFSEPLSLERMARELRISVYYLSRTFSRENGFSITSYLTAVRMAAARDRLRAREGNVSEVAYSVGYESSAYFSRVFKKHFGFAPRDVPLEASPKRS